MAKFIPDKFAVMVVDPGKTTGVGTGVFRTDKGDDMIATIFERAVKKRQIITWHETGDVEDQAFAICMHWANFRFKCNVEYGIPIPDIHLVIESFHLRELQAELHSVEIIGGIKTVLKNIGGESKLVHISIGGTINCAVEVDRWGNVIRVPPVLKKHRLIGKTKDEVMQIAAKKGWIAMKRIPWALGEPKYQTPSVGKSVKNDRLKRLGIWVTGSTHQRDVLRHMVSFVDGIL